MILFFLVDYFTWIGMLFNDYLKTKCVNNTLNYTLCAYRLNFVQNAFIFLFSPTHTLYIFYSHHKTTTAETSRNIGIFLLTVRVWLRTNKLRRRQRRWMFVNAHMSVLVRFGSQHNTFMAHSYICQPHIPSTFQMETPSKIWTLTLKLCVCLCVVLFFCGHNFMIHE